jgi:hypothetical protein
MPRGIGLLVGGLFAVLAGGTSCRMNENERAAVDACRKYGVRHELCRVANANLQRGVNVAEGIRKQEETIAREKRSADEAARLAQEMKEKGEDPCAAVRGKLVGSYPGEACAKEIDGYIASRQDDPGCAAMIREWDGNWSGDAADFLDGTGCASD